MRNRLLLIMVGVVALVLAVHDIPLAGHLERVERDRLVTKLERDAFVLAGRTEEALEDGVAIDDPDLETLVAEYSDLENVRVVVVDAGASGVIGSEAERTTGSDFSNRPEIVTALTGEPITGERESATLGEELFYVAVPVLSGDQVVGAVRITAPERVVSDRASARVRGLFVVAGISLLIAMAVAWLFAKTVTRPLVRLRSATHDLATGDLSSRADDTDGPPEVRELGASFNSMADRLEQLIDRQRAFAGTASHQLRTPLTALRLRLEQVADEVAADPAAAAHVDEALAETDRLHRMIEGLLALSRAEDAATGPVAVDLGSAVGERVEQWSALADERAVRLTVNAQPGTQVMAVPGGVEQIIDNLIDNALEASPADSSLTVGVVADDHGVALHVIDEGPGLSEAERGAAFDRFWRGTDASPGGSGLGLAIVHQLAAAGGATAELHEAPTGGIDAVVTFHSPVARPTDAPAPPRIAD